MATNNIGDAPLTLSELGRLLRAGDLSSVELTDHYLARIEALDPKLNAFRIVVPERARAVAKAAEVALRAGQDLGPLHGIPFAAKDLFDVAGLPTTAGCSLLNDNIATEDSAVVRKLSAAGMVLLGKTNTVQFAYGGAGINNDHGTPHNPWSEEHRVPGGSSSGSGVAVGSGMAPMALGSDTGGSVRIPAALCSTTGLKTTVGQVSRAGVYPLSWSLDSVGPLTRTVVDAALVYTCIHGADPADDSTRHHLPQDVLSGVKDGVRGLRLAFAETAFFDDVDPEIDEAVRACGEVFSGLGAAVVNMEFPQADEALRLNPRGLVIAAEAYVSNKRWVEDHFDALDPVVSHRMIKGRDISAPDYLETTLAWERLRADTGRALRDVDALLVPTTPLPARPVSEVNASIDSYSENNLAYLRNTAIGNILNLCGLSVPCGFTKDGLPIGLMIYGKPFDEDLILRIGCAFQEATDWHTRRPDLGWAGA
ncbi:MAG: amidase [Gammaproteobacteria bacterium]